MALVNHAKKEINAKIVYYGPAGSGKSTALSYIYSRIKPSLRGEMKSIPAGADTLQFFDFSPFEAPLPNGYRVRLHIYTLTGSVTNPATWKMTLKGTDGIMILINPDDGHAAEAVASVRQLRELLSAYGVGLHETPAVLQLNSPGADDRPEYGRVAADEFGLSGTAVCSSDTASGDGILEALTLLSRRVLDRITAGDSETEGASVSETTDGDDEAIEPEEHECLTVQPVTVEAPRVSVSPQDIVSEGNCIRIPLDIMLGATGRRIVVTVNVDLV